MQVRRRRLDTDGCRLLRVCYNRRDLAGRQIRYEEQGMPGDDVQLKATVCFWCKAECGLLAHVSHGRLVKLDEDPDWPIKCYPPARGCVRRKAAVDYFYHPGRLNYPLKRVGERGEGKWQRIPWQDALDEIAAKLGTLRARYGAETLAASGGTARTHDEYRARFFNLFGSPNLFGQERICFGPRSIVADAVVGMFPNYAVSKDTNCVLLLGAEPLKARPMAARAILEAKRRGAKMIVVDPSRSQSARMADVWLPLRPGTDSGLLLGMIGVIIDRNLYDRDFVEKWCFGFDELKNRLKEYPLETVSGITGLPSALIERAAVMYATNGPACCIEGMGLEHSFSSTQALHARWILSALCGNLDVRGGETQMGPPGFVPTRDMELWERLPVSQWQKMIGAQRFRLSSYDAQKTINANIVRVWGKPVNEMFHQCQCHTPSGYRTIVSGDPYPVTALITTHSNPMVTEIATGSVYQALTSPNLQLYVVNDFFMTPSAELADYVLPMATWLERPDLWSFSDYGTYIWAREAAVPHIVPGQYEHYRDFDVWRELGLRLGQAPDWPWLTLEDALDYRLKPLGYSLRTFPRVIVRKIVEKKYETQGFATTTGKVEFHSTVLESLGYDPLPKYLVPPESRDGNPELAKEYPYTLIGGRRSLFYYHSEWRQVPSVRRHHPDPIVRVHPETAAKEGIKHGDWIWIETRRGRIRQKVELFEHMAPDIVDAEHGWWFPEMPCPAPSLHGAFESNLNVCMSDDPDQCNPEIGSYPLRTALCRITGGASPVTSEPGSR
jgi:thiosulfate reductase/polysulfide reductase chain A